MDHTHSNDRAVIRATERNLFTSHATGITAETWRLITTDGKSSLKGAWLDHVNLYLWNGWSSQVLSTLVDGQCDKLVTVVGHQFITLTVDICVQHCGREAPRRADLSVPAEICLHFCHVSCLCNWCS